MRLYEDESRQIVQKAGIPVSAHGFATTAAEARRIAEEIGATTVIKSQVLTGGRMKAGGVKFADSPAEAEAHDPTGERRARLGHAPADRRRAAQTHAPGRLELERDLGGRSRRRGRRRRRQCDRDQRRARAHARESSATKSLASGCSGPPAGTSTTRRRTRCAPLVSAPAH